MTERLAGELASLGFTIVSGLARGIDGLAHEVALRSGGRTLAVCGHGLDRVFPPEHEGLARAIAEQGALVSEFPLSTPPFRQNFPRRNRIISGLALGCVVVEASGDSGSLITARCALEQGREVFAVPGLATTGKSRGAHRLIQQGATLVESADDILEALPLHIRRLIKQQEPRWEEGMAGESFALEEAFQRVSAEERALLTLIRQEPYPIDRLIEESGLSPSTVSGLLVQLELRGLVQRGCDGRFGLSQAAWS
jgi:DNA processing protein